MSDRDNNVPPGYTQREGDGAWVYGPDTTTGQQASENECDRQWTTWFRSRAEIITEEVSEHECMLMHEAFMMSWHKCERFERDAAVLRMLNHEA